MPMTASVRLEEVTGRAETANGVKQKEGVEQPARAQRGGDEGGKKPHPGDIRAATQSVRGLNKVHKREVLKIWFAKMKVNVATETRLSTADANELNMPNCEVVAKDRRKFPTAGVLTRVKTGAGCLSVDAPDEAPLSPEYVRDPAFFAGYGGSWNPGHASIQGQFAQYARSSGTGASVSGSGRGAIKSPHSGGAQPKLLRGVLGCRVPRVGDGIRRTREI